MFRRRVQLRPLQKLREAFWPSIGWKRATIYVWRRIWRLTGTPHAIALGCAAGAFMSFTPLLGLHILLAILIAWVVRGNLIAAAFGTLMGNPLSYPPIWVATYDLGNWMLGTSGQHHIDLIATLMSRNAFDVVLPVLMPMVLGALPLGLIAAVITYFIVKATVSAYQIRKRERLEARLAAKAEARLEVHPARLVEDGK